MIGWKRFKNIKSAVMSDQKIILEIIQKICNAGKTFAFHHNESAQQRSFGITVSAGCSSRFGKIRKIKAFKKPVIKFRFRRRCKQRNVLYNFLAIDKSQPLSYGFLTI